jgi:GNAT superfamily N-acetyltransferase
MPDPISIVPYRADLAPAFIELNRAWIEQLFALEPADWKVLRNPQASIVDPGGEIYFALDGGVAVGTAAAIRTAPGVYELAKMAVAPSHQGRGLGEQLGRAVVEFARNAGAERLFLVTNSRLANAIRLYQRLGFVHAPLPPGSEYARAGVSMEVRFPAPGD